MTHQVSSTHLDFDVIRSIISDGSKLVLSEASKLKVIDCRAYIDKKLIDTNQPYYGINTGFGALYNKSIPSDQLEQLQINLIMSHACGTGDFVPDEIIRLMLFLKIQGLSYGNSGVQVETIQRLIDFFNESVLPVVYTQGSLGASGDLSPLAHLCLPLIGLGKLKYRGEIWDTQKVYTELGWKSTRLKSKEGLALLNGTQFMSAYATWAVLRSERLLKFADIIAAISLEAFDGRIEPFHSLIQQVRPHAGQIQTALFFRQLLNGSELIAQDKIHVQDPYSFRCIPQVHGASKDAFNHVSFTVFNEVNAVTDNPTVFPEHDLIISAGNFHGQPLALTMDYLAIAMAEIASISERRTYQLISGQRGLPAFLVSKPGLNSGFMIPQYTAASIVSQNKQLCTPASVDSIVSSNGQEDHVSMGANAATKLYTVINNVEKVLAIELMNACQALDFRRPQKSSAGIERIFADYRKVVSFVENDRVLYTDIEKSVQFICNYNFENVLS